MAAVKQTAQRETFFLLNLRRIAFTCGLLLIGACTSSLVANADGATHNPNAATILHNDPRIVTGESFEGTNTAYYARIPDGYGKDETDLGVGPIAHAVTISGKRFIEIDFSSNGECGSGGCFAQSLYYLDKPTFVAVRRIDIDHPDRVENGWLITQLGAFRHPNSDLSDTSMSMAAIREDFRRQDVGFGYFNRQFMRRWNWKVVAIQPEPRGATVQVFSVEDHLVHARACGRFGQLDDVVVENGAPSDENGKRFSFVLDHVDSLKAGMWVRMIGGLHSNADPHHDAPTFPRIVRVATQREAAAAQLGTCQGG